MILNKLKTLFKNPNLSKPIKDLTLTVKTQYVLSYAGIEVVGDLVQLSRKELKAFRGAVRGTVMEVEGVLKGMGLKLKEGDK